MQKDRVNLKNARKGKYSRVIAKIAEKGVCPFCTKHLRNHHTLPITKWRYWWVTDNMYPYKPTKKHKLLIHRRHIESMDEVTAEAWIELLEIVNSITTTEEITGGTFLLRFGETKFTGASVVHLHAHLVQSDPDSPNYPHIGLLTRIG